MLCSAGISTGSPAFHLYTADLSELAAKHGVTLNNFADDTQLYLHCNRNGIIYIFLYINCVYANEEPRGLLLDGKYALPGRQQGSFSR